LLEIPTVFVRMRFDLSNRNLQKIVPDILKENLQFLTSSCDDELVDEKNVESALFDNNCLSKLDSLDIFLNLKHVRINFLYLYYKLKF